MCFCENLIGQGYKFYGEYFFFMIVLVFDCVVEVLCIVCGVEVYWIMRCGLVDDMLINFGIVFYLVVFFFDLGVCCEVGVFVIEIYCDYGVMDYFCKSIIIFICRVELEEFRLLW